MNIRLLQIVLLALALPGSVFAQPAAEIILMRHALAPGVGDPAYFRIEDCGTQRNLSEAGKAQARKAGGTLKAIGFGAAPVYTSQWCRCRDTARLLDLGPVTQLSLLNSFFETPGRRDPQTTALGNWLYELAPGSKAVLVTHQVNITALTGLFPNSSEMLHMQRNKAGEWETIKRIKPPEIP